jgi:alpha-methylacyl-CoA racemase
MGPLNGIQVLDLSRLLPGPMCTWYLRGMGADVVKIEDPQMGDYLRFAPPHGSDGLGAWFSALNAGKRSVALDLKQPAHQAAMAALIAEADVLVESFRPGVMARLGMDPEELRRTYPRLVICSITGYGQTGPMAALPGHDLGYVGLAGGLSLGTRRDGVPDLPGVQVADVAGGGLTAAMRICAALFGREQTGQGAWLDVSMTEGVLAFMAPAVAAFAASRTVPAPGDDVLTGASANYQMYRCKDGGVVAVAPLEPKFWMNLVAVVGEMDMDRSALAALFATRDRDEWAECLGPACVTPMLELWELAEHPQHRARGALMGEGAMLRVVPPFPSGADCATLPAPDLGAHTAEELARVGFDSARMDGGER